MANKRSIYESRRQNMKIEFGSVERGNNVPSFHPIFSKGNGYDSNVVDVNELCISTCSKVALAGLVAWDGLFALTLLSDKELDGKVTFKDLHRIFESYETVEQYIKVWMEIGLIEKTEYTFLVGEKKGRLPSDYINQIVKVKPTGKNLLGSMYSPFINFECVKNLIDKVVQPIKDDILIKFEANNKGNRYQLLKKKKDEEFDSFMKELDVLLS